MKNNKKVVRLTEAKLKQMIAEAVQETLNEYGETPNAQFMLGRLAARKHMQRGNGEHGDDAYNRIRDYARSRNPRPVHDEAFNDGYADEYNHAGVRWRGNEDEIKRDRERQIRRSQTYGR